MGSSNLQQLLRSLCVDSEWKYAMFWRLKDGDGMVLTCEDVYYDTCDPNSPENKWFGERPINLHGGHYSHDLLGLAVAKMSYYVYPLGEGIVGEVAVSGCHRWICAEDFDNSCSSFEIEDRWKNQFSAGVKTVVVVAVCPDGVVQFGSLSKVNEDMKLVTHIRDFFLAVRDFSQGHATNLVQHSMANLLHLSDLPTKSLVPETFPDFSSFWFPMSPYTAGQSSNPLYVYSHNSSIYPENAVKAVKRHEGFEASVSENGEGTKFGSGGKIVDPKNQVNGCFNEAVSSGLKVLNRKLEHNLCPYPVNSSSSGFGLESESVLPASDLSDSNVCSGMRIDGLDSVKTELFNLPGSSNTEFQKDSGKLGTGQNHKDPLNASSKFFAGCELLEALRPAFLQKINCIDQEVEMTGEDGTSIQMPEEMSCSQLTFDSSSENLLEAVVANACLGGSSFKSEAPHGRSLQPLTTAKTNEPSSVSSHAINLAGFSFGQPADTEGDVQQNSSEVCGASFSSGGLSSTYPSICTDQLEKPMESHKSSRRRARPGEASRPRPRDRQLIQDRIKELRDLVPSGSKCSIDALLERTIRHMLFLQSVTKHAEKLSKCAESKMHHMGTGALGSSNRDQGSSWAVEVGGHLKVCSIIVENLSKHGQMLVEMLCEECCHFLEIAEAIKSLGLTILKGVTKAHGDKSWLCFIVEGQNNKMMHRMDILWSLVRIFQPKTN